MASSFRCVSLGIYVLVHTWLVVVLSLESRAHFHTGVVNVLLLYNTFRVLGLAFYSHPTPTMGSANESFGTPEFRRSKGLWGSYKEKGNPYSRPISLRYSQLFDQTNPTVSDRALLLVRPERAASVQSFYRRAPSPPIGHHIMPAADLHQRLASSDSTYSPTPQSTNDHECKGLSGLPAAPRRQRSPVLHLSDIESSDSRSPTVNDIGSPARSHPSPNEAHRWPSSPNSASSAHSSPTHWLFRQSPQGSTNSAYIRPMLSAVTPVFPSPISPSLHSAFPRYSRSLSTVSMTGPVKHSRQRTILARSVDSNASEFAYAGKSTM